MANYCVGRVLEPETRSYKTKNGDKTKLTFGLLTGRSSVIFSCWSDDSVFADALKLHEGDIAIAQVGYGVNDSGKLLTYLNKISVAAEDLPEMLGAYFN